VSRQANGSDFANGMTPRKKQKLRTYHATVLVTRAEEWCVEASSPEEARARLASGDGHRCHLGDVLQIEVERMLDQE
jgi:hypothetical protein